MSWCRNRKAMKFASGQTAQFAFMVGHSLSCDDHVVPVISNVEAHLTAAPVWRNWSSYPYWLGIAPSQDVVPG